MALRTYFYFTVVPFLTRRRPFLLEHNAELGAVLLFLSMRSAVLGRMLRD